MNNETPAYNYFSGNDTENPGPPNQSLPRAVPGTGIMGFDMVIDTGQGENFYRAALSLNNSSLFENPNSEMDISP